MIDKALLPDGWRIYVDAETQMPEILPLARGQLAAFCARRPGKEAANEDSVLVAPLDDEENVLVVADGAGGLRGGADASRIAVENIVHSLSRREAESDPLEVVESGIGQAHRAISGLGLGAATTVAGVWIERDRLRSFHTGDSMVLVVGQRGKLKLCTTPHSPVGYAEHAGLLDEKAAMFHQERHLVSNLLGIGEVSIEESRAIKLRPRDTVVIASDGLFDNLFVDEIVEIVRMGPLPEAIQNLVDETRRRMITPVEGVPSKPDDLGVILFRPI